MGIIMYNGVSSKDVGIEVETFPAYEIPKREYQVYHVPGRNGDLVIDAGTFENVTRTYKVSIATWDKVPYATKMRRVAEWLHSTTGYSRLEDSYDKDVFRMAYYADAISLENLFDEAGRGEIKFICKPQRFLKRGEDVYSLNIAHGSELDLVNETGFDALPFIKVVHSNLEESAIVVTNSLGRFVTAIHPQAWNTMYIDSELQDAWSFDNNNNVVNENVNVVLENGEFIRLVPGLNRIGISSSITSIEIIPRWWTI